MLERKITNVLNNWKNEEKKPCLLVRGARQVGKTFIIEEFAKNNYESYIYINFELHKEYKEIFNGNLDFNTLKMKLELTFSSIPIIPNKTLLFLDEIQSCPNARTALKSFAIDGSIDVVASGSLLGLYYKEIVSYPVGYERVVDMYPLDFEEFLWANGIKKDIIEMVKSCFYDKKPIDDYVLRKFEELFNMFIVVGGMPNVVNNYVNNKSLISVLEIQRSIIEDYKLDVLKYADINNKQKILNAFNSIPFQLSKRNKKFMYKDILENERKDGEKKYYNAIDWLRDAGIVNFCYNLTEPAIPLASNVKQNSFKLYMRDTGLLVSMLEDGVQMSIINDDVYINCGALVENVCASIISTRYSNLLYFEKKGKLEIGFILNINGKVTAIEVKSGNSKQAKSLLSIINNYKMVSRYVKFEKNTNIYVDNNNIEHYPLFMIMFI